MTVQEIQAAWQPQRHPLQAGWVALCAGALAGCVTPAPSARPPAFASTLLCGEQRFSVGFAGDALRLQQEDGRILTMTSVPAASGSRYAVRDDPSTFVWFKGERARVVIAAQQLPECQVDDRLPAPYRARGNEPFWSLDVGDARLAFDAPGARVEAALPAPVIDMGVRRYTLDGPGLTVSVQDRLCADSMSGMPHPHTVEVRLGDRSFRGCGGDPAALLRGGTWTVESLDGAGLLDRSAANLSFSPDGRVAGQTSCNRYAAAYALTGESLTVHGAAATRRACEPALMSQEQRFLAALQAVRRFELGDDGMLRLIGEPGHSITARRTEDRP